MESIRQYEVLDKFTVFYDDGWKYQSVKTKEIFTWKDFDNSDFDSYQMRTCRKFLEKTEKYEMFDVFNIYWLNQLVMYSALEYAGNAKKNFTGNPKKADAEATRAFNEYYNEVMPC